MTELPEELYDDETTDSVREKPDLATALRALETNTDGALNATIFYGLSGLTSEEMSQVQAVWHRLPDDYRHKLLQQLVDINEANVELDYRTLALYALHDDSPGVRVAAIELLWEDESLALMNRLIEMAQWDEVIAVRAAAVGALGRFILLGELGDLSESEAVRAQDVVIGLLTSADEDIEVRRRSLESIANCGHEIVPEAIDEAYQEADSLMRSSALFAMGKACDARWADIVLRELDSPDPALRYEAVRASGELELDEAIPQLTHLAQEDDREIKAMTIWALGEIGGGHTIKVLTALAEMAEEASDDDLLEIVEEALSSASLAGKDLELDFDD